jgi:hypothetical protein|tara:strand:- start:1659 stop:1943 length:285 start_codon:yes stop_codon:yes gene_type:complete
VAPTRREKATHLAGIRGVRPFRGTGFVKFAIAQFAAKAAGWANHKPVTRWCGRGAGKDAGAPIRSNRPIRGSVFVAALRFNADRVAIPCKPIRL